MAPKVKWNVQTTTSWFQDQGLPYKALKKINNPKKVIFQMQCPNGTIDEYDLSEVRRQITKGIIPCKCCRRKARLRNAMGSFLKRDLIPLNLESDYKGSTSYLECRDCEGFIVRAQETNSRDVTYSRFTRSNKKSIQNVKKLALDIGFKELISNKYIDYDTAYEVMDHNGLLYHVYIGNMLDIKREGKDFTEFQKYRLQSPFLEHNIKLSASLHGYEPISDTLDIQKKSIGAITPEGYHVEYNPYQLEGTPSKPPNPFDSRCKYFFENIQKLIIKKRLPLRVDKKRKILVTIKSEVSDEGYLCPLRPQEIREGKMPEIFDESNPFSIRNIRWFCRIKRPDYRLVNGQKYKGAKTKYLFKYRGRDLKPYANPVFECDWSNFKSGKGHPDRFREVCKDGVSNNFSELRQVVYNSVWRKMSMEITGGCCILSGVSLKIEVHHLVRAFSEIVKDAIQRAGLDQNSSNEYTDEERKKIVDEFVILHAREPLGVPLTKDIHLCFHRWIERESLPVNKSSFNKFKKVWKIEFEHWKTLRVS